MEKVKAFISKFRIQYNSPVILTYALAALLVLLLQFLTKGWTDQYLFSVYRSSPADLLFYVRLFGHALGHADFNHFLNNFIIILLIGPMLEEKYGSINLLIMMLTTALVTGLTFILLFGSMGLMGASGVVFMMILLSSFVNLQEGKIPLTLLLCIPVFIGREIVDAVTVQDNVSQISHILGGLCGAFFGFYLNKKKWFAAKVKPVE